MRHILTILALLAPLTLAGCDGGPAGGSTDAAPDGGLPCPDAAPAPDGGMAVTPDPFMWAGVRYEATGSRPVGKSMWVGKSAWANQADVKDELAARVAAGEIPYVFFYHWGDGPGRTMGDFQNATAAEIAAWEDFARAIAQGIGTAPAYVVIEPEWDSNATAAGTPKYQDPLRRIIAMFREVAPNTLIVNGPGLWKPDEDYAAFAPVAPLFDLHGFLVHVVSSDPDCTWRTNGTSFGGGSDLAEALTVVDKIRTKAGRLQSLFGAEEILITDLAVTRCGWGDDGQRQILATLVDAFPALYDDVGLRGSPIRNGGPSNEAERYLGVNNEGMFGYVGYPGEAEVIRGAEVIQAHLAALASAGGGGGGGGPGPAYAPAVTIGPNVNDHWIEVYADDDVTGVEVMIAGAAPEPLPRTDWGSFAASLTAPRGTELVLIARRTDGASAGTRPFAFQDEAPVVEPGWDAGLTVTIDGGTLTASVPHATAVELKVGAAAWQPLAAATCGDTFSGAFTGGAGDRYLLRARRADGATAYGEVYTYGE